MGWFLLILVLLAAAFGVLGVVLKITAILVFTIVLSTVILVALGWWFFKRQARRFTSEFRRQAGQGAGSGGSERPPDGGLPAGHDDRY
jgi:peptidoglycan/LPS O-acetylase OafA/YrhL